MLFSISTSLENVYLKKKQFLNMVMTESFYYVGYEYEWISADLTRLSTDKKVQNENFD